MGFQPVAAAHQLPPGRSPHTAGQRAGHGTVAAIVGTGVLSRSVAGF
jgi:hypothetical protein